jgi:nucleotide-binding universal stress UspA family protein
MHKHEHTSDAICLGRMRQRQTELRGLVMEVQNYQRNPTLHAEPAALPLPSELGGAAHDQTHFLMSGPVEHLLAATDFAEGSKRAVARALERGSALGAQVTLLHVIEEGLPRKLVKLRQREARDLLSGYARSLSPYAYNDISINVRTGDPSLEIIREAIELGSDAIVLGLERRSVIGDETPATAIDVVRYSDKPVLMVALPPDGPYGRAVIDVDPYGPFGLSMQAAQRLVPQAETHVVRVAPTGASHADSLAAIGKVVDLLMNCVSQIGADLLVVGSDKAFQHAHDDPSSLLRQVSDNQRCDLLFVRNQ